MKANPPICKENGKLTETTKMLYKIDLFKGLDPKELTSFFSEVELKFYPAGSIVFSPEDSSCERLYILKEGRVERYRLTERGKRLVTRRILPEGIFGVMGLLGRNMQGNFAEAAEDSHIYVVTREHVLALLKRQPDLTLRLLEIVSDRLRLVEERLLEAVYSPVSIRLANLLLATADPISGILTNISHDEIGNMIGAARQTITINLNEMRKQGILIIKQKRIQIVDRRALEQLIERSQT
jgi:CRP/FNR family transcriptional regulator